MALAAGVVLFALARSVHAGEITVIFADQRCEPGRNGWWSARTRGDIPRFEGRSWPERSNRSRAFRASVQQASFGAPASIAPQPGSVSAAEQTRASANRTTPRLLSAINPITRGVGGERRVSISPAVPYHTSGRAVVGSIDLEPGAWHWTWNVMALPSQSRFQARSGGGRMRAPTGGRIPSRWLCRPRLRTSRFDFQKQRNFILGTPPRRQQSLAVSVRPWDITAQAIL